MHKTLDRGVCLFVERIQSKLGVVRKHDRLHREKLAEDRVIAGVLPVNAAQDVGAGVSKDGV